MTLTKHLIAVVGLVVVAWTLNVTLCDWAFKKPTNLTSVLAIDHGSVPSSSRATVPLRIKTGLVVGPRVPMPIAAIFGVTLPVALVFLAAFLAAHWRQQHLQATGRCRDCGHQLAGAAICPECGRAGPPITEQCSNA